jgi:DNA-directed RNA polymerase specialized sigma subunit
MKSQNKILNPEFQAMKSQNKIRKRKHGDGCMSQEEIAIILGTTRENVSQIEKRALEKIRGLLALKYGPSPREKVGT